MNPDACEQLVVAHDGREMSAESTARETSESPSGLLVDCCMPAFTSECGQPSEIAFLKRSAESLFV